MEEAMNDLKQLGWMSVVSIAVFALAGCGQASARGQTRNQTSPSAAAIVVSDAHPTSDAEGDNGPGCAESALNGGAHQAPRK